MTEFLTILLSWSSFFKFLVLIVQWPSLHWDNLTMLLYLFPLIFLFTQKVILPFVASVLILLFRQAFP